MLKLYDALISIIIVNVSVLVLLRVILSFKSIIYSLREAWQWLDELTQAHQQFEIPKYNQWGQENSLYRRATAYVASLPSLETAQAISLFSSGRAPNDLLVLPTLGHPIRDSFLGCPLSWTHSAPDRLVLRLRRHQRPLVLRPYLQHIESVANDLDLRRRHLRLHTTGPTAAGPCWRSVPFTHPATLDALAMDADLKARLRADLDAFSKGRAYYHGLGRPWRRSYLLHGPPGTGKSSFVAAMAKHLCFDIYDLDPTTAAATGDLKTLLLSTTPRSIILVENLDRHLNSPTIAGILSFMDGVFSCCGEERLMVFTMTTSPAAGASPEGINPAVLRPGRLDVHVHFPLCDFASFKKLAGSYLGLTDHKLYPAVEEVFLTGARISQAEVGEIMVANRGSPGRALRSVMSAMQVGTGGRRLSNGGEVEKVTARRSVEAAEGEGGQLGKELRKLYGMIKMRSGRRDDGFMFSSEVR